jgi:hypothetical protein
MNEAHARRDFSPWPPHAPGYSLQKLHRAFGTAQLIVARALQPAGSRIVSTLVLQIRDNSVAFSRQKRSREGQSVLEKSTLLLPSRDKQACERIAGAGSGRDPNAMKRRRCPDLAFAYATGH